MHWGYHSAGGGMPGGGQGSPKSIPGLFLARTQILGQILPWSFTSQWILSLRQRCLVTLFLFNIMSLKKMLMICTQCNAASSPGGFPGSLCTLINNDLPYHHSNLFIQHQGAGLLPCRQKYPTPIQWCWWKLEVLL